MDKIFGRFKKLNWKEVKNMKKLILIAAVLAIAFAFLPKAEAGDAAELGLSVSFKLEPLKLWAEPSGPFSIAEGSELKFSVTAEDLDAKSVTLKAAALPEGANFYLPLMESPELQPTNRITGVFTWTPAVGQAQSEPYQVEFYATSSNEELGLGMIIKILVRPQPVISIELTPTTWVLGGVKLGEKKSNIGYSGVPIHQITNTGNVLVMVDIGYGPQIDEYPSVRPGLAQGKDTFTTEVVTTVIPPDRKVRFTSIMPGKQVPLSLTYGAPIALSQGIKDHGVTYELRAYADIIFQGPGEEGALETPNNAVSQ